MISSTATIKDIPAPVLAVLKGLLDGGFQAFLVGGCVRDMLRGVHAKDFDLATSAQPPEVQKLFRKVIPTGIAHGTVTVVQSGMHVEVTTFRSEAGYVDGRRPTSVTFHTDIEADLSRRDFTMNAMALDPIHDRLVDPFNGKRDLEAKLIRCVGVAMDRFSEDGLRALRAVRFAAVLGFTIEEATEAAIAPTIPIFKKVAGERVHQEFTKLLLADHAIEGLELLQRTSLLDAFFPEANTANVAALEHLPKVLHLRLAPLLIGVRDALKVLSRQKFTTKDAEAAVHLANNIETPAHDAHDAQLRRWLAKVGIDAAPQILEINRALGYDVAELVRRTNSIISTNPPLTAKDLALDGAALMRVLDIGPSKVIGDATRFLVDLVLEDPSLNSAETLTDRVKAWHASRHS